MVRVRAHFLMFSFILGLLAVLAAGISMDPPNAAARPYSITGPTGTSTGTGDPTGDDQPSPTPKPTSMVFAPKATAPAGTTAVRKLAFSARWNLYLSIFIRLGLR